ncbi:bifunctional proline dehydrogenase/L-glutamate gamma-semialdehyde dehydrogenase [Paramagnetospirillum marisnigri]|uniref:Bifunctional protein PutA n=1 Tax=Paramagnetospirillum marisnigri TaxID=1285242 RepID=A0A178M5V3_9PROT|nr:L-glutamate gamma-semialdehyde dehydrogenase [Paramagnetospirillum marisnigri]OAN43933.1 bifunctional proline dehydrogenase/L-glutamate gamma-semialdehyde dehydrogenase [Paramagnetospirillum marisnigri]
MIQTSGFASDPSRAALHQLKAADQGSLVPFLAHSVPLSTDQRRKILAQARAMVELARTHRPHFLDLDGFLAEYRLSTPEGVALMCLAEALLRIPDAATQDRLIDDKLGAAHWEEHLGHSPSSFVNASTWALMFGARGLHPVKPGAVRSLAERLGHAVMRRALIAAMGLLGRQFVMGRSIEEALAHSAEWEAKGYRHSFDMLGEAARTGEAARHYFDSYAESIAAVGRASAGRGPVAGPGISVKLSALHPRYEMAQRQRVRAELIPRLLELCRLAKDVNIGLTVDAEEADRLDLSLDAVAAALAEPSLAGWDGFGLAVQAYQTRAQALIGWLADQARAGRRRLMLRLVKGAYWDSEIKRAQERGLDAYPVFTTKAATDISYLACAAAALAAGDVIFPQFATHNAHTMAAVAELAGSRADWEFQRLHGMGESLYHQMVPGRPCRTYAPVGSHQDLLPYLVRRLLENGANTSFVNRLADSALPVAEVVGDPLDRLDAPSPIPQPRDLFAAERINSRGLDLACPLALAELEKGLAKVPPAPSPPDADPEQAMTTAATAFAAWDGLGAPARAALLDKAADALEADRVGLMALAIIEAGKTIPDALAEIREAVDFLRFYAAESRRLFAPHHLPGPVGEANTLSLRGRGVFVCISPWNFPLAIFVGQVAAALAAGNTVVAKPAEQTPLMAARAVRLLHAAGIPKEVLHLVPGGPAIGAALVSHPAVAGVAFTGSTATAKSIQRALAAKDGPIVPLIAETGGINAMIADSSALTEQLLGDVMESAFRSAGQRCSALRLLLIQREAWVKLEPMLVGAMAELVVGDPKDLASDIGPVIDAEAKAMLEAHAERMAGCSRLVAQAPSTSGGLFFAPRVFELADAKRLDTEVFGPILHVVAWESQGLDAVIDTVAASGYGLTLGIHSRIDATIDHIRARLRVGNVYVNRSMIGAVVGSQPFGGQGLSGTGPKAGGPNTLLRYAAETCLSVNTAAAGGDAAFLAGQQG